MSSEMTGYMQMLGVLERSERCSLYHVAGDAGRWRWVAAHAFASPIRWRTRNGTILTVSFPSRPIHRLAAR